MSERGVMVAREVVALQEQVQILPRTPKRYHWLILLLFIMIIGGCTSSKPMRIDFSCISHAESDRIVTNCADPETWRRWIAERQQGQWQ